MHKLPQRHYLPIAVVVAVFAIAAMLYVVFKPVKPPEFELEIPIACAIGTDCFIQNYVDVDPSTKAVDYTCGPLTYDGHKGTDFRLRNLAAMRSGVKVLAASGGLVKGIRDGMDDTGITKEDVATVKDRECGNGVVIDHGNGWETQYCHMKKGSIAVKTGDQVITGQPLGMVGYSGLTEFPHLHLSVRKNGAVVDPFSGGDSMAGCKAVRHPLWSREAQLTLEYVPTAILQVGFSADTPMTGDARDGAYQSLSLPADSPYITFWVDMFGIRTGDIITLTLTDPEGHIMATNNTSYDKNMAVLFRYIGKKRDDALWPKGTYHGDVSIVRSNAGKDNPIASFKQDLVVP